MTKMTNKNITGRYCLLLILSAVCLTLRAQETKIAKVSAQEPFEDKLKFDFDDKGLDLTVSLSFDEAENILTLKLTSDRSLILFKKDTRYDEAFRHPFLGKRHLEPKRLPFAVMVEPNSRYDLSGKVYKNFRKPRSRHLINATLGRLSPELTQDSVYLNTPQSLLTTDQEIKFRLKDGAGKASVNLRNIMVVDAQNPKKRTYEIVYDKDLNLTYDIQIERNPCYGTQEAQDELKGKIANARAALRKLLATAPSGSVSSQQEASLFGQHRSLLQAQYPPLRDESACEDLNLLQKQYNSLVDSIASSKVILSEVMKTENGTLYGMGMETNALLNAAHQLDNMVTRILMTGDRYERNDLLSSGRSLIQSTNRSIEEKGVFDEEQRMALDIYRKAEQYFNSNAKK